MEAIQSRLQLSRVPKPEGYTFQNRFVVTIFCMEQAAVGGSHRKQTVRTCRCALAGGLLRELSLVHGVDRIEQMGPDAVVVGTDERFALHFHSSWRIPEVADRYTRKALRKASYGVTGFLQA